MKDKDTNKSKILLITIVVLMFATIFGFFGGKYFYDLVQSKKNPIASNEEKIYETITQAELEKIVENELYILDSKISIAQIKNTEKLAISLKYADKEKNTYPNDDKGDTYDTISVEEMNNAFKKTSLGYLNDLKHESFKYNKKNSESAEYIDMIQLYYLNAGGLGYTGPNKVFSKLVNFTNKDGVYTISYKYAFNYENSAMGTLESIYGSYNDSLNQVNPLKDITMSNIEQNYESIKSKLTTYNYYFEKKNNIINLIDFNTQYE